MTLSQQHVKKIISEFFFIVRVDFSRGKVVIPTALNAAPVYMEVDENLTFPQY